MTSTGLALLRKSASRVLVLLAVLTLCPARPVVALEAMPVQVEQLEQFDRDGDGRPDLAILDVSLVTRYLAGSYPQEATVSQAKVSVYDRGGDMQPSEDWKQATDFENDVWLFDTNVDGRVELIIEFGMEGENNVAYLYDDRDGDGMVRYQEAGSDIEIAESQHWTVKVSAFGGWRSRDGSLNYNVQFDVDGLIGSSVPAVAEYFPERFGEDGSIDWETELVDSNHDSIPEYQVNRILAPIPDYYPAQRAGMYVNPAGHEPSEFDDQIFWPFLVTTHWRESYNYFDYAPAVFVDWETARIERVGLAGYPIESGYHINNFESWDKGIVNEANFENPMAYYDMAADNDGEPELFARLELVVGTYFSGLQPPRPPIVQADMSWDQNNDGRWDYKVDLAGKYLIDSTVSFHDFAIKMVPYELVPWWVTDRMWDAALFVAGEAGGYRTSEGIYGWAVNAGYEDGAEVPSLLRDFYITGYMGEPPTDSYAGIWQGMRGEYAFELRGQPYLYFSTVDHRLHLVGAQHGIWNIDDIHTLEYDDVDGDGYIDKWTYLEGESTLQQLFAANGYLTYAGDHEVRVLRVTAPPAAFSTLPPRDHQEWLALQELLDANRSDLAASDLKTAAAQFSDVVLRVEGGSLRDFRLTGQGSRFVLDVEAGASIASGGLAGDLSSPGSYVVSQEERLSAQPLTPPHLKLGPEDLSVETSSPTELESLRVTARVHNLGLEDAHQVTVTLHFSGSSGQEAAVSAGAALVGGGETQAVTVKWTPPTAGQWQMLAELDGPGAAAPGDPDAQPSRVSVVVRALPQPVWRDLLSLPGQSGDISLPVLALFASAVAIATYAFLTILRHMAGSDG